MLKLTRAGASKIESSSFCTFSACQNCAHRTASTKSILPTLQPRRQRFVAISNSYFNFKLLHIHHFHDLSTSFYLPPAVIFSSLGVGHRIHHLLLKSAGKETSYFTASFSHFLSPCNISGFIKAGSQSSLFWGYLLLAKLSKSSCLFPSKPLPRTASNILTGPSRVSGVGRYFGPEYSADPQTCHSS